MGLLFFGACARQMPPPGGPPDETPPRVIATVPADDSVRVALDTPIRIRFSEPMDRQTVERAVFVSPQGSKEPEFRWRGRELEIRLSDGLQADRTYLVTVGQESADEWRNRMRASFSFGFATGERVNRGELHGRVLASDEQKRTFPDTGSPVPLTKPWPCPRCPAQPAPLR